MLVAERGGRSCGARGAYDCGDPGPTTAPGLRLHDPCTGTPMAEYDDCGRGLRESLWGLRMRSGTLRCQDTALIERCIARCRLSLHGAIVLVQGWPALPRRLPG